MRWAALAQNSAAQPTFLLESPPLNPGQRWEARACAMLGACGSEPCGSARRAPLCLTTLGSPNGTTVQGRGVQGLKALLGV